MAAASSTTSLTLLPIPTTKKKKEREGETCVEAREKEDKGGKRLTTWVSEWYDGTTRDDKESRALQGAAATSPVHLANFLVN